MYLYVFSLEDAIDGIEMYLSLALDKLRVYSISKVLVVISHVDEATVHHDNYKEVLRRYTEVYEKYFTYWPELQMKIVPVDSMTGWNFMPHNSDSTNDRTNGESDKDKVIERYRGPSLIETLRKFHADGLRIDCPWRLSSLDPPSNNSMEVRLMAGELKVGDLLIESEITREIEEITIGQTSVKSTHARSSSFHIKLKGTCDQTLARRYLYGPGVRTTSKVIVRMMLLEQINFPTIDPVTVRSCGNPAALKKLTILHYLDPITYEKIAKKISQTEVAPYEVFVAEIELFTSIRIEVESTYGDLAKICMTAGSSPLSGTILAIGTAISAEWDKK